MKDEICNWLESDAIIIEYAVRNRFESTERIARNRMRKWLDRAGEEGIEDLKKYKGMIK